MPEGFGTITDGASGLITTGDQRPPGLLSRRLGRRRDGRQEIVARWDANKFSSPPACTEGTMIFEHRYWVHEMCVRDIMLYEAPDDAGV